MNITHLKRNLIAAAVLTLSAIVPNLVATGTAHAATGVVLRAYCNSFYGTPSWAGTNNTITIDLYWYSGGYTRVYSGSPTTSSCVTFGNVIQGTDTAHDFSDLKQVVVTTNGTDSFWMDTMTAWRGDFLQSLTWGAIDTIGYCFDGNGTEDNSKCWNGLSYGQITFTR